MTKLTFIRSPPLSTPQSSGLKIPELFQKRFELFGENCGRLRGECAAPLDQTFTMHTAVNRLSRSGRTIEPDGRITPLEPLEAVTVDGARLYGEDATKGTIEVGKLADLIVLAAHPLAVPPATIETIRVEETIKEGKAVCKQPQGPR